MNRTDPKNTALDLGLLRSLQAAWKASLLYSPKHPSTVNALDQAYANLRRLFDTSQNVTLGFNSGTAFVNQNPYREKSLEWMEGEFEKRHIASVVIENTTTPIDLRQAIEVLSAPTAEVEDAGGTLSHYERRGVRGIRLIARKMQNEHGGAGTGMGGDIAGMGEGHSSGAGSVDALLSISGQRATDTDWTDPGNFHSLARHAVSRTLSSGPGGLLTTHESIVGAVEHLRPHRVLSALPFEQASGLAGKGAQDIAVELTEDFTAEWTVEQLSTSKPRIADRKISAAAEATHAAASIGRRDRLARKLAQSMRTRPVDPAVLKEYEDELRWASMTMQQRTQKLMQPEKYSDAQFERLLQHIRELLRKGFDPQAVDVAEQHFSFLSLFPEQMELRPIERSPELLLLFPTKPGGELEKRLVTPFAKQFKHAGVVPACHQAMARCIPALVELAGRVEDFSAAAILGAELENWTKADKDKHKSCCEAALNAFLSSQVCNQLVEIFLEKRGDDTAKQSASLLRMSGSTGAEAVLSRLEHENSASHRRALMRLLGLLGTAAIAPARKRLSSDKWYVVRNICSTLADLKDTDMASYFKPALCHKDPRVQQAAFTALTKSRSAGRAQLLAESLPYLSKHLMDPVLEELMFVKDPACLPALEEFAFQQAENDKIKLRLQQVIKSCRSTAASA